MPATPSPAMSARKLFQGGTPDRPRFDWRGTPPVVPPTAASLRSAATNGRLGGVGGCCWAVGAGVVRLQASHGVIRGRGL
jgi:hypothetical protein